MKVLFNFTKSNLLFKGVPYEDVPKDAIRKILNNYIEIYKNKNYDSKVDKSNLKEHIDYLFSMIQGNIMETVDSLAFIFDLDYRTNVLMFDRLFKERKNNKKNISFLQLLDSNDLKILFYLEDVILAMVNKIKEHEDLYKKMIA